MDVLDKKSNQGVVRPTYGLCTAIASTSVSEGARTITTQYIAKV
jgi:hypothetical protein